MQLNLNMEAQGMQSGNDSHFKKLQKVNDLVEVEWLQLQRRYGTSFTPLKAEASGSSSRSTEITGFQTSDPDFDKTLLPNGVTVRIVLSKSYPAEAATVEIFSEELERKVVDNINAELANLCAQTKGAPQLRNVLKWLDRRLGQEKNPCPKAPIEEDVWTLSQQQALEKALGEYPANMEKKKRWILIGKSVPGKVTKQCINRFNKIRKQVVEERQRQIRLLEEKRKSVELQVKSMKTISMSKSDSLSSSSEALKDQTLSTGSTIAFHMPKIDESVFDKHQGLKCLVDGLEVSGIGWACIKNIRVHGLCISCGLPMDITINQSSEYKGWCASKKCSKLLQLKFEGLLLHNQNLSKLGIFESSSIIIQDILKISMTCSCFECGTLAVVEDLVRGKSSENSCHDCHRRLRILFQNINLQGETKQPLTKSMLGEFKSRMKRDPRIVPGKPLPNEGTCKHYRKSHRWLRFPCCGKAYPCDVCHELESGCDETPWARRQICGYCSKEQDFSKDLPCIHCGKSIGLGKYTSHWEGGKGQRNKVKMSTKDSKKYTNSNMKTRSNKANRVGNTRKLKDKEKKTV